MSRGPVTLSIDKVLQTLVVPRNLRVLLYSSSHDPVIEEVENGREAM